ncbi:unnamed protein product [Rhodiola kirilowii]
MILQSFEFSGSSFASSHFSDAIAQNKISLYCPKRHSRKLFGSCRRNLSFRACVLPNDGIRRNVNQLDIVKSGGNGVKGLFPRKISNELESEELYQKIGVQDMLRTQIGVNHPIPPQPINSRIVGLLALFFFFGVIFDQLWTSIKKYKPDAPTSFSLLVEKDLQRKESVEWVNMVLDKLWKVYRTPLENWIIGSLQPVFDDLEKPDFVKRVEIKQFSLGNEPLSVRSVDRITSRRVNDLQDQIGIRYTGGARMLLKLSLKFGIIPVVVPVNIWDFDIDGELWVKLRLIPTEPWVGAVSWAFVSLPRIKFFLSPFRLFNLMGTF